MIAELQNIAIVILKDTDSSKSVFVLVLSNKVKYLITNLRKKLMQAITIDIIKEKNLFFDINSSLMLESIVF